MTSRCSGDNRINARRSSSPRSFSCKATSGSFAGSAMVAPISSFNPASVRRRRADSALWRAIDISHVETEDRHWKRPAWRHTSRKTVLGKCLIADEPKKPAVDVSPMPREQNLHRWFAANGDLFNQVLV